MKLPTRAPQELKTNQRVSIEHKAHSRYKEPELQVSIEGAYNLVLNKRNHEKVRLLKEKYAELVAWVDLTVQRRGSGKNFKDESQVYGVLEESIAARKDSRQGNGLSDVQRTVQKSVHNQAVQGEVRGQASVGQISSSCSMVKGGTTVSGSRSGKSSVS